VVNKKLISLRAESSQSGSVKTRPQKHDVGACGHIESGAARHAEATELHCISKAWSRMLPAGTLPAGASSSLRRSPGLVWPLQGVRRDN
jgi:hypothetical protein